jgi:hypothetical protein
MKAIFAVVIVSILVLTALCGAVRANPTTTSYAGPSSPDTSLPKIDIILPENNTVFNQTDISYSIVITKPPSWFSYGPWNGQIFSVTYSLDNSAETTIAIKEFDSFESLTSKEPITLQGTLNGLSDGNHTFKVLLFGVSYYQDSHQMQGVPSNYYIKNNATATFAVNINLESNVSPTPTTTSPIPTVNTGPHTPQAEPFPTLTILVVALIVIAAIIACLSLYRRNRKTVNALFSYLI